MQMKLAWDSFGELNLILPEPGQPADQPLSKASLMRLGVIPFPWSPSPLLAVARPSTKQACEARAAGYRWAGT